MKGLKVGCNRTKTCIVLLTVSYTYKMQTERSRMWQVTVRRFHSTKMLLCMSLPCYTSAIYSIINSIILDTNTIIVVDAEFNVMKI